MKITFVLTAALCLVALASARPKYIAIPVEDIQFLSFAPSEHHRVARQAVYAPREVYTQQDADDDAEVAASEERQARQAGHGGHGDNDYVDYGAHTGHHGAFGWYADFPVHTHGH